MGDLGVLLWAQKFRKISVAGRWQKFSISKEPYRYPFLQDIYNCMRRPGFKELIIKKPTQVGVTELCINTGFYFIDTKGENVIYMLPSADQLGDFAHARLDKVINNSPYISNLFSDISNVGLKVGKRASFYLRGSNSESKLEEVPAGCLVRDELTYMNQDNAKLAKNRLDASQNKWIIDVSHPRYPGEAIDARFKESTAREWLVICEACGEKQQLKFLESVARDPLRLVCRACGKELDPMNGQWSEDDPDNPIKGYHLSQLFSPTVTLEEIVQEYESATAATDLRLFYNNRLGIAWSTSKETLSYGDVQQVISSYQQLDSYRGPANPVMGVDVGERELYYWIQADSQVLKVGTVRNFAGLDDLLSRYQIKLVVVDLEKEARRARQWGEKIRETTSIPVWLCRRSDRLESEKVIHEDRFEIKVNKTDQLDAFFYQFQDGEIELPRDLTDQQIDHLTTPYRVLEDTASGKKARWKKGKCDFADGGAYAKLAQELLEKENPADSWKADWGEPNNEPFAVAGKRPRRDPRKVLLSE